MIRKIDGVVGGVGERGEGGEGGRGESGGRGGGREGGGGKEREGEGMRERGDEGEGMREGVGREEVPLMLAAFVRVCQISLRAESPSFVYLPTIVNCYLFSFLYNFLMVLLLPYL